MKIINRLRQKINLIVPIRFIYFLIIISAVAKKRAERIINVAACEITRLVLNFRITIPPIVIIPPIISIGRSRSFKNIKAKIKVASTSNRDRNETVAGSISFSELMKV